MRLWILLLCGSIASAQTPAPPRIVPFDLRNVRLLPGPFLHAMEKDRAYLLSLKPARLLARCRQEAGLVPQDSSYGGWEREGLSSHFVGHYLSACALEFRATGDSVFLRRVHEIVNGLAECQAANGDGYVGGMPGGRRVFAEVAHGDIRSKGFDLNGLWSPWYTLHKIMAGLRDAYSLCGNEKALRVLTGMASWACKVTENLDDGQFQRMLRCEYGGMNEVLADVSALTGEGRYRTLAERFTRDSVLLPLARREDRLQGFHGNTIIPKLIGAARLFELTGDERMQVMSRFFWETVTRNHTYVAGGHGENEYFGPPRMLSDRLSESTMETCNTYNMLKLTRFLFGQRPAAEYADYYERALYNHILASQNPDDGMVCYFVPLGSGTYKTYSTPEDDCTCCLGTGMENHVKYGDAIYFHDRDSLIVNLFIASELTWAGKGIRLRQRTRFPDEPVTTFEFDCAAPVRVPVRIRHPFWADGEIRVLVNGERIATGSRPGSYFTIDRIWKTGDRVKVILPMSLRLEPMPDNAHRAAILYGPLLLAADLGPIDTSPAVPVLVNNRRPLSEWIKQVGDSLLFRTIGVGRPADIGLIPFFRMHHRRHAVYFDMYTDAEWADRSKEILAREEQTRDLEARTIDVMRIGEMQPERDHNLQGEKTSVGEYRDRKWRLAVDNGFFSFFLKVDGNSPSDLVVTYWGSESGKKEFDICIDGDRIATQLLERIKPDDFADVEYAVPDSLTRGKERVTVSFVAHRGTTAGRVFGCRMVRGGPGRGR
jgi:DUF1680 family protein